MTHQWALPSFEKFLDQPNAGSSPPLLEEARLEAFEKGYKDGWDDALRAATRTQDQISNELAQAIQDASFNYVEARNSVISDLRSLASLTIQKILPDADSQLIIDTITKELRDLSDLPSVIIRVSEGNSQSLQESLKDRLPPGILFEEVPDLKATEARIISGTSVCHISSEEISTRIQLLLSQYFFSPCGKDSKNG